MEYYSSNTTVYGVGHIDPCSDLGNFVLLKFLLFFVAVSWLTVTPLLPYWFWMLTDYMKVGSIGLRI